MSCHASANQEPRSTDQAVGGLTMLPPKPAPAPEPDVVIIPVGLFVHGTVRLTCQKCWHGRCAATKQNLPETFPELKSRPRPEPDSPTGSDHDAWKAEYEQWGALRCSCGRGYFCREHGSWISGEEVGSDMAPPGEKQQRGQCPSYHYTGTVPGKWLNTYEVDRLPWSRLL